MSTALTAETNTMPALDAAPAAMPGLSPALATGSTEASWPKARRDAFAVEVAGRLRAAPQVAPEITLQVIAGESRAMAGALADPQFVTTAINHFSAALNAKLPQQYGMPGEDAARGIISIFLNRIYDCKNKVALLGDPAFIAEVRTAQPKPAGPYQLPPGKREEMVRRLVQPDDPAGFEPAVHDQFGAIGHRIGHDALAEIFREGGPLLAPLTQALQRQAPQVPPAALQQVAAEWLKARFNPALAVADEYAFNGQTYQQALAQSDQLQAQKVGISAPASHAERAVASKSRILVERV